MGLPTYNNAGFVGRVETYYFTGTDTLQTGYALCFDQDASTTNADTKLRLGSAVEKPATANLNAFAGVVAPQSGGKTGPCYVDVIVPTRNTFAYAFTDESVTAFTTGLAPQNGSYALDGHADSGLNLPMVAIAAETVDTETTNANALIMWR